MYNFIKQKLKTLIPQKLLFKSEPVLRNIYAIFYSGSKHQCNICDKKLSKFIALNNGDLLCPSCGSLSRTRRLWSLLKTDNNVNGNILHFSPSRSLYRTLKKVKNINYYSTDFEDEFLADYKFDITKIDLESNTMDTMICYHILEHILDDKNAMNEMYRVLKPNGKAYVQTPFKSGGIYEDNSIVSEQERLKHFGQEDHVRIYSIEGLKDRLEASGFKVEVFTFNKTEVDFYSGFQSPEVVLKLTK